MEIQLHSDFVTLIFTQCTQKLNVLIAAALPENGDLIKKGLRMQSTLSFLTQTNRTVIHF